MGRIFSIYFSNSNYFAYSENERKLYENLLNIWKKKLNFLKKYLKVSLIILCECFLKFISLQQFSRHKKAPIKRLGLKKRQRPTFPQMQ